MTTRNRGDRQSGLTASDSVVQRMVSGAQQRQQAELGADGRGRPGHAGRVGVDNSGRSKVTLDMARDKQVALTEMARAENLTKPDVAEFAIALLYDLWRAGKIDLEAFKTIVYSDKQTWRSRTTLRVPDDFDFFSELCQPLAGE
jgi:hypothetical protein